PAIVLTPYAYSDTNGHEATAPTAATSQSGSLRRAVLLTNWVTRPVRHQGTMASERTETVAPAPPMMAAYGPRTAESTASTIGTPQKKAVSINACFDRRKRATNSI